MESSPLLNFPQMVDMIFGTFESGIINIKMLHSFLHALMSQLSLDNVRVRLHGSNYEDLQRLMSRSQADVQIIEYWFDPECPDTPKRIEVDRTVGAKYDKVVVVQHNEKENQWLEANGAVEMPPIKENDSIGLYKDQTKLESRLACFYFFF
jgi:glutaredoxin